jgi:hypothetical protein
MQNDQKSQNIGLKFDKHTQDIVISEALTDTKKVFLRKGKKYD